MLLLKLNFGKVYIALLIFYLLFMNINFYSILSYLSKYTRDVAEKDVTLMRAGAGRRTPSGSRSARVGIARDYGRQDGRERRLERPSSHRYADDIHRRGP